MHKNLRRGLSAAALVLPAWAAHGALTDYFTRMAFCRRSPPALPGTSRYLAGQLPSQEVQQQLAQAAAGLRAKPLEKVTLTARDGTVLVGHWYCPADARRAIVAMHGWRSSWDRDFGLISDFWFQNRCAVLFAQQRGQGESGGDYMGFGLLERFDCLDWVNWVSSRTSLPLYLGGISMGAATVLMAAGEALPERVKGVVADCGYSSAQGVWRHVARNNLHISYASRQKAVDRRCRRWLHCPPDGCTCPPGPGQMSGAGAADPRGGGPVCAGGDELREFPQLPQSLPAVDRPRGRTRHELPGGPAGLRGEAAAVLAAVRGERSPYGWACHVAPRNDRKP